MRSLSFIYCGVVLCGICVFGLAGCSQKDREETAENASNAVQKAYDKTTQVLRNVAEGINDAVY